MTKPRRRQAGEGGISAYETKSGVRYLTKHSVVTEDGARRVLLKRGHPTRAAAAAYLRAELAKVDRGEYVAPTRVTVGEWLDTWLAGLRLAPSTMSSYRKNVRLHLKPTLGAIPLQRLTGPRITRLYRDLEAGGRQDHQAGTGLSARTVRYCHVILKAALREAVRQDLIPRNPAELANPPSAKEARAPEIHPWTAEQLRTFLTWCRSSGAAHATAYHLLASTGMRRGEALALARDDALIFGTLEGGHLHPERFSRSFVDKLAQCRRRLGDAAPPAIKLHDLRHTHATLLLRAGEPVKVVQERLGHASPTITLTIYAHVMPGMQKRAAETFAALIDGA